MKKHISYLLVSVIFIAVPFGGCKKSDNSPYPDVNNFSATALSNYTIGSPGNILVTSASLAPDNYTVKYHYTYDTGYITGQSATLVMKNHTGSFQTSILTQDLVTYVTLDSIINSIGKAAPLTKNNLVTLCDSTGQMTLVMGSGSFQALYVAAEITTNNLYIDGECYLPGTTDHQDWVLEISNYTVPGIYSFNYDFFGGGFGIYTFTGSSYVIDTGKYGTINITASSPLLTGTFSVTCTDSTKITGSFSCVAP
jgi:hypothetical protein